MIIKLQMVMKNHIMHNFSFYIHKKINIQNIPKMKEKTKYQINIFLSKERKELPFLLSEKITDEN